MTLEERAKLISLLAELSMLSFHRQRLQTLPGQLDALKARLKQLGIDADDPASLKAAIDAGDDQGGASET